MGAPEFLKEKISTSSSSLSVVWRPPPVSSLNGEFLGYEMTYKAENDNGMELLEIKDNSLRVQVISVEIL